MKQRYSVVILGTDGSGKSTIINHITPFFASKFPDGIVYNHLRPNLIPDLGVLLGKKKVETIVTSPHAKKQSGLFVSLFRWGYYMIDYTLGYAKVVMLSKKSSLFIFDRYYYDYYIDQKRLRTNLPQWILRVGEYILPRPDLILCFGGDPQKIYERKPETSLEEVMRQTQVLKAFCAKRNNAVWIDTTIALEDSVHNATNKIFNMMNCTDY
ncbi:MAG: hypothetical protein Q4C43_06395 [Prevotella sp.]|nr:hypothetical protein [Prevotella sp.]